MASTCDANRAIWDGVGANDTTCSIACDNGRRARVGGGEASELGVLNPEALSEAVSSTLRCCSSTSSSTSDSRDEESTSVDVNRLITERTSSQYTSSSSSSKRNANKCEHANRFDDNAFCSDWRSDESDRGWRVVCMLVYLDPGDIVVRRFVE